VKRNTVKSLPVKYASTVLKKDYNNKEWVKSITSLIPAIMIHLPLLLTAIATANSYNKTNKDF
jgi:hypothetical protein